MVELRLNSLNLDGSLALCKKLPVAEIRKDLPPAIRERSRPICIAINYNMNIAVFCIYNFCLLRLFKSRS